MLPGSSAKGDPELDNRLELLSFTLPGCCSSRRHPRHPVTVVRLRHQNQGLMDLAKLTDSPCRDPGFSASQTNHVGDDDYGPLDAGCVRCSCCCVLYSIVLDDMTITGEAVAPCADSWLQQIDPYLFLLPEQDYKLHHC